MNYEIIGNKEKAVAIIESHNKEKDKKVAQEMLKKSKHIKSVLAKISSRKGRLRKRQYKLILGSKDTEVIHKEHGFLLKLDPQKVYFSPRELTERQRLASKIKKHEKILVMFSGVIPIICAIKKKQPETIVYGIELNRIAHKYALENKEINKLEGVYLIQGDVKKKVPALKTKFDRIIMPLPKTSGKYLYLAFKKIKKNGIIHYYTWGAKEARKKIFAKIKEEAKLHKKKIKILNLTKVSPYAPKVYKIRIDLKIVN
ncbi:MAG: hypothetical protein AABX08_00395 [Nanoarchaeota archaeon]